MNEQEFYDVAIYCRLSRDDETQGESSSILTQKNMLTSYAKGRNWRIVDTYIDDGISGTTFERSGFKRMIHDIEDGKINMVITKDLSRLGRDYLKTGFYTECFFPENDVRYIAVNDGIDTINNDNDIAPFKNILNEMYAKDISKKIKSAYKVRIERGEYHGAFAPFGYAKDPVNKGSLIIDPESSKTVHLIFSLAKQGYRAARIRTILIDQKISTPAAYLHKQNPKHYTKLFTGVKPKLPYKWTVNTVARILNNEVYIGNKIHYKEISVSYKSKRRQNQPREKWHRVENTHEPLIDKEVWDLIQARFKHRGTSPRINPPNIFQRIVRCADCGKAMWLATPQRDKKTGKKTDLRYFQCVTYREYGKLKCSVHATNYNSLYLLVLQDIRHYAKRALEKPGALLKQLVDMESKEKQAELKRVQKEQRESTQRLAEIKVLLECLFEENVAGRMNHDNYAAMFDQYQREQSQLRTQVQELDKQYEKMQAVQTDSRKWVNLIAKYADLQELDAPIINELCEKILCHKAEKINGKRVQRIEIFYRFIGRVPSGEAAPHQLVGRQQVTIPKQNKPVSI